MICWLGQLLPCLLMWVNNMILLEVLFFCIMFTSSTNADEDCGICYHNVTKAYEDLFRTKFPNVTEVPPLFPQLPTLSNDIHQIRSNITNISYITSQNKDTMETLNEMEKELLDDQHKIEDLKNRTGQYDDLVKQLEDKAKKLREKMDAHKKVRDECDDATKNFENLKKIVSLLEKLRDTSRIYDETQKLMKQLNSLEVPESVYDNFVCNSKIIDNIDEIISGIRKNIELFERLLNDFKKEILNKLEKISEAIENMNNSIDEGLKNMPKTDITFDDETSKLIPQVEKQLNNLIDKFNALKRDYQKKMKEQVDKYIAQKKYEKQKELEEYELVLKTALEAKRKDFEKLLQEKQDLQSEMDEIKEIAQKLIDGDVCDKNSKIDIEEAS